MNGLFTTFNYIDVFLLLIFILPLLAGALSLFSRERISYSLGSLLNNIELAAGIILSVYFTKRIFFVHDESIFNKIYGHLPDGLKSYLYGRDILTYIVAAPVILLILLAVIRFVTVPLYNHVIIPFSDRLYISIRSMGRGVQRLAGALWQVPKALVVTLVAALVLNFSTYYIYSPNLSESMGNSVIYNAIYSNVLLPILNSNIAKQIPVIVNDSFRRNSGSIIPDGVQSAADKIRQATNGKVRIIEYFNGVTLEEAIKSNHEIDVKAASIVGNEKDDTKKAYLIYKWISRNIKYDYDKAARISQSPEGIKSGSVVAFETRKGICFDFSSLYVTMCRAVGLKVRLITGLGYSGTAWGDHAWNQVYSTEEGRWINVDSTFGASGVNYFDKRDFTVDHSDAEIQGEW